MNIQQAFMAFHTLNAWEDTVEVEDPTTGEKATQSVLKVITCDFFEMDLNALMEHKSTGEFTGMGRDKGRRGLRCFAELLLGSESLTSFLLTQPSPPLPSPKTRFHPSSSCTR